MKKQVNFLLKQIHWGVFVCFLFFEFGIFHTVPAFGDDYYYGTFFRYGFSYFVSENNFHYFHTNGRALVHLVTEAVLLDRSMLTFHIVGTLLAGACVFLLAALGGEVWRCGLKTPRFRLSLLLSCAFFSGISVEITRQSVYWATGMLNYFLPIPILLFAVFLMRRAEERGRGLCRALPFLFFAAWSTEQCGAAALACAAFPLFLCFFHRKKPKAGQFILLAVTLIGFLLLFFAPGNRERMTYYPDFYAKPLFQRILSNIPIIANGLFSCEYMGSALALLLATDGAVLLIQREKRTLRRLLLAGAELSGTVSVILSSKAESTAVSVIGCAVSALSFAAFLIRHTVLFLSKKENGDIIFFSSLALILQLCMLFSPEYGGRTVLCSVILLFLPTLFLVRAQIPDCEKDEAEAQRAVGGLPVLLLLMSVAFFFLFPRGQFVCLFSICFFAFSVALFFFKKKKEAVSLLLLFILLCGFDMSYSVFLGYRENAAVHRENERLIAEWKREGDETAPLILYYLKNGEYKHTMPYENSYHLYWFKKYRDLPPETEIRFGYYPR